MRTTRSHEIDALRCAPELLWRRISVRTAPCDVAGARYSSSRSTCPLQRPTSVTSVVCPSSAARRAVPSARVWRCEVPSTQSVRGLLLRRRYARPHSVRARSCVANGALVCGTFPLVLPRSRTCTSRLSYTRPRQLNQQMNACMLAFGVPWTREWSDSESELTNVTHYVMLQHLRRANYPAVRCCRSAPPATIASRTRRAHPCRVVASARRTSAPGAGRPKARWPRRLCLRPHGSAPAQCGHG
jgi:hypothetical protein